MSIRRIRETAAAVVEAVLDEPDAQRLTHVNDRSLARGAIQQPRDGAARTSRCITTLLTAGGTPPERCHACASSTSFRRSIPQGVDPSKRSPVWGWNTCVRAPRSRCSRWTIRVPNGSKTFRCHITRLGRHCSSTATRRASSRGCASTRRSSISSWSTACGSTPASRSGEPFADAKTPYVVFTHGMLDPWFKRQYPLKHVKKWLYWPWAEYRVLRDATAVLFTSEEERRLARRSFWLYRCNEVVINYGTAAPPADDGAAADRFRRAFPSVGRQAHHPVPRPHPREERVRAVDSCVRVDAAAIRRRPGGRGIWSLPGPIRRAPIAARSSG